MASVLVHPDQFPANVQRDLLHSLRERRVMHKFHYDSVRQMQKWLALHEAYAPSKKSRSCERMYLRAFQTTVKNIQAKQIQLSGLCCGDGSKESQLLKILGRQHIAVDYVPCDCSVPMVLAACENAQPFFRGESHPIVCDLETATDLPRILSGINQGARKPRLVTFFGTLHNYEPALAASRLSDLIGKRDLLLIGANLASEKNYATAVKKISTQYDNALTHDWLCTFLFDLGLNAAQGKPETVVEHCPSGTGLLRIGVYFRVTKACSIRAAGQKISFRPGERIKLFFSYRYTPRILKNILAGYRLQIAEQWVGKSEEEGIFLCRRF